MVSVNEEKRDWRAKLRNWFSINTIPFISIQQLCMKSLFVSAILPLFTVSVLFYSIFTQTTSIWGMSGVVQLSTISNHRSDSIQKNVVMLFCFVWAHLCICAFQIGWQKKAPQYWWEELFKLMASTRVCFIFFVGVTILMSFLVKSLHINVKEVHMRLWMGFCLKQGKGHLNFESCFYNIYLIFFPQHSILFSFWENTNNHTGSFPSLHKISFFYSQF